MPMFRGALGLSLGLGALASPGHSEAAAQGPLALTRISVQKFEDVNGNGARDPGEPPVENVTFNLFGQQVLSTGKTDVLGQYCFQSSRAAASGSAKSSPPAG